MLGVSSNRAFDPTDAGSDITAGCRFVWDCRSVVIAVKP